MLRIQKELCIDVALLILPDSGEQGKNRNAQFQPRPLFPSVIRFDIAEKQSWEAETNTYSKLATRSADIYVFCVLAEKDKNKVDPLDSDQWLFMVIPTSVLNDRLGKQKSVGLSTLERIGAIRVTYSDLASQIEQIKDMHNLNVYKAK